MQKRLREEFLNKLTPEDLARCEEVTLRDLFEEAEALIEMVGPSGLVSVQDFQRLYYAARQIMSKHQVSVDVPRFKTVNQLSLS